jgi:TM2 domain-containing membrane protein YozV/RNA polymerase subunit RPABC4/transcription elongation factor Spt4
MVICPDCRKDVPKAKFCKNCGAYIANIPDFNVVGNYGASEIPNVYNQHMMPVNPEAMKVNFCYNCGNKLIGDFNFCPECGQDLNPKFANQTAHVINHNPAPIYPEEKNIILAVVLSVFLPGLGQIYLDLNHKGAMFLIGFVISVILILFIIGFFLCIIVWAWALVDTITSTNALNRGENVEDRLF